MADLDDFFAKKDKKKSKGKKFTTVDQVAKKLEDTGKKPLDVKPNKKEKEKSGQDGENVANNMQEDDEWKEFEEEKKDYSGLKIQNMQLTDGTDSGGQGGDDDDSDDGEGGEGGGGRGRKAAGPWKMPSTQESNENDSDEEEEPQPVEPEPKRPEPKETTSSYVPPHLRNQPPAGSGPSHQSRMKSKTAPDINNEAYFPTLSAAAATEPVGAWGKKGRNRDDERGFEDVRNSKSHSSRFEGGRQPGAWGQSGGSSSSRVSVENKFDALRQAEQS